MREPFPFNPGYYSHKFKAAGLRYEIAVGLKSGDIVWGYGGLPCGIYNDLRLAREAFVFELVEGEKAFGDKGYGDSRYFILPRDIEGNGHKYVMSRHETVNKRIRHFEVLKQVFRHPIEKHEVCFFAVLNITQLILKYEEPLYSLFDD